MFGGESFFPSFFKKNWLKDFAIIKIDVNFAMHSEGNPGEVRKGSTVRLLFDTDLFT